MENSVFRLLSNSHLQANSLLPTIPFLLKLRTGQVAVSSDSHWTNFLVPQPHGPVSYPSRVNEQRSEISQL